MMVVSQDDVQLRYEHAPRPGAPALLLLNSMGASLEMWDDQLAALGERFELIRFDARGHGKSTSGSKRELAMDDLARDALAVLDACGVARAHLCGLSLGGMVAMHLAAQWPDRVLKAVLCSTSAYMPSREHWDERIRAVRDTGMAALAGPILGRWFTPEFYAAHPASVARIRDMIVNADPTGYAACAAAVRDMDQREALKTITAKTLVIGGERDAATPPEHARLIAATIADAQLRMLDAAHLSNIERADEFTAALLEFLAT